MCGGADPGCFWEEIWKENLEKIWEEFWEEILEEMRIKQEEINRQQIEEDFAS